MCDENQLIDQNDGSLQFTGDERTDEYMKCSPQSFCTELDLEKKHWKCVICRKSFQRKSLLNRHERTHTGEKPFACIICYKSFKNRSHLKRHKLVHTGERPFECSTCKKAFVQKQELLRHERTHTGIKPYKCSICYQSFTQPHGLKYHVRNVHKIRLPKYKTHVKVEDAESIELNYDCIDSDKGHLKCAFCCKLFHQKYFLMRHQRVHTGERPFTCLICNTSFTQKHHLTGHKRVHTGEKPYQCLICQKSFSKKHVLNVHKRVHTGAKPYKCTICSQLFTQSHGLKYHIRNVHKNEAIDLSGELIATCVNEPDTDMTSEIFDIVEVIMNNEQDNE